MADINDWSRLPYQGDLLMDAGTGDNPSIGGGWEMPQFTMPDGREFAGGIAGKYSKAVKNGDGTFTITRMDPNKANDNQYQTATYKVDPTGQFLEQQAPWESVDRRHSDSFADFGKFLATTGLLTGGAALAGSALGGAGAGAGSSSVIPGGAGALEMVGTMPTGLSGVTAAGMPAIGGTAAGAGSLLGTLGNIPGGQVLAGLLGGAAGIADSGDDTTTKQSQMDPRMDPYVYGDGGVLQAAKDLYEKNKGGNPMVQRGAKMTEDYYTSPEFVEEQKKRREIGMGLLSGGVAGNPFTTGEATLSPSNNGLLTPYMQTGLFAQPKKKLPTAQNRG